MNTRFFVLAPQITYLLGQSKAEKNAEVFPALLLHLRAELRPWNMQERGGKNNFVRFDISGYCVLATESTYRDKTSCVHGPPRAAEQSMAV